MSFLKTLLGALCLCAALLAGAAFLSGSNLTVARTPQPGLTAAAVLASDGMGPDGRTIRSAPASPFPAQITLSGTQGLQPAG